MHPRESLIKNKNKCTIHVLFYFRVLRFIVEIQIILLYLFIVRNRSAWHVNLLFYCYTTNDIYIQ